MDNIKLIITTYFNTYKDKLLHFGCGFIISLVVGFIIPIIGLVLSLIAGIGKELYDKYKGGSIDYYDILATFIGGLIATIILIL